MLVAAATGYLVFLHAAIAAWLWQADAAYEENLGNIVIALAPTNAPPDDGRARHIAHAYYQDVDRRLRAAPVALLGDSLTEGMPAASAIAGSLNLGLGGLTMRELTAILPRFPSLPLASAIVVTIGINDFCLERAGEAEMARRIGDLAAALPPRVPLLWGSILPLDPEAARPRCATSNAAIVRANAAIAQACAARPGCFYADAYHALADAQGNLQPRYHVGDGIHLSAQGYAAWLKLLEQGLARGAARRVPAASARPAG